MALPLLLVDVDGVLFPWRAGACPTGFDEHVFPGEEPVWLSQQHGMWLRSLAGGYDLVWATGWGHDANRLIAPALGLPRLPVIDFPSIPFPPDAKVPAIAAYVGDRAAAWIDDQLGAPARDWAADRPEARLLVDVDAAVGLTRAQVDRLHTWAAATSG